MLFLAEYYIEVGEIYTDGFGVMQVEVGVGHSQVKPKIWNSTLRLDHSP